MKARIRKRSARTRDIPVPEIDPNKDLPAGSCLIQASKGLANLIVLLLFIVTLAGTMWFYEGLANMLLAGENRETTQGTVEGLHELESGMKVNYVFQVAGREVHGNADLSKEQSAGLKPGSPIEIAYARSMQSVYRLNLLLSPSTENAVETGYSLYLPFFIIFCLWFLAWCICSWEHVYLFIRYFVGSGGVAWNQALKALHNAVFTMLSILLGFFVVGIAAAHGTGAYAHLWPWQVAGIAGTVVALGLLLKWTPFRP